MPAVCGAAVSEFSRGGVLFRTCRGFVPGAVRALYRPHESMWAVSSRVKNCSGLMVFTMCCYSNLAKTVQNHRKLIEP